MKIEVLLSTMNLKNEKEHDNLIKKMNINNSITINQISKSEINESTITNKKNKLYSYKEKGLSKSRNKAISKCTGDICVIADDDLTYVKDYEKIILNAYNKYPQADIIAFDVPSTNEERPTSSLKDGKVNYIKTMKLSSFQITFKKDSIVNKNLKFDENFGAGSGKYTCGEENIFLFEAKKAGLKIYYSKQAIAQVTHNDSTWYNGFNEDLFTTKGAMFYRMNQKIWQILIMQFAIRKYKLYKDNFTFVSAIKNMIKGKNEVKKNR